MNVVKITFVDPFNPQRFSNGDEQILSLVHQHLPELEMHRRQNNYATFTGETDNIRSTLYKLFEANQIKIVSYDDNHYIVGTGTLTMAIVIIGSPPQRDHTHAAEYPTPLKI